MSDPGAFDKVVDFRLAFDGLGAGLTVIDIIFWAAGFPMPVIALVGTVSITLIAVGIIGHVAASSESKFVTLGDLRANERKQLQPGHEQTIPVASDTQIKPLPDSIPARDVKIGSLNCAVFSKTGGAIENATIVVENEQTSRQYRATTDHTGNTFIRVPCGNYSVTVEAVGYSSRVDAAKVATETGRGSFLTELTAKAGEADNTLSKNSFSDFRVTYDRGLTLRFEVWYFYDGALGNEDILINTWLLDREGHRLLVGGGYADSDIQVVGHRALADFEIRLNPSEGGTVTESAFICLEMQVESKDAVFYRQSLPYKKVWKADHE